MYRTNYGPVNWEFGDEPVEVGLHASLPSSADTAHDAALAGRRRGRWLVLFMLALVVSWTTGFYLGRLKGTTTAIQAEVQGRLDVEAWAWQQGDWDLFRSLLPRRTPSWRLKALEGMFQTLAPTQLDLKMSNYEVSEDGTQIDVVATAVRDDDRYEVARTYRLIDGRWRLTRMSEFDDARGLP